MQVAVKAEFGAVVLPETIWTTNKACLDRVDVGIEHKSFKRLN